MSFELEQRDIRRLRIAIKFHDFPLKRKNENKKLITEINTEKVDELIQNKTISGGMIPKIKNCLDVASNGVKGVCIIDGRLDHSILFELLSNAGSGTLIRQ